ncbi:MAG: NFYB/HAP3 family transcription factor subunit [Alphaproteobacteria bacterium]|nr:NFYB/HAP3 family transcription factor subunit [Alphaproteobacteria bacterium]
MTKTDLPKAPINRMFKKIGGDRLSAEARDLILEDVEDYARGLMKDCLNISKHVGRKTVMAEDVKLAKKLM